jgi:hypothetical protein
MNEPHFFEKMPVAWSFILGLLTFFIPSTFAYYWTMETAGDNFNAGGVLLLCIILLFVFSFIMTFIYYRLITTRQISKLTSLLKKLVLILVIIVLVLVIPRVITDKINKAEVKSQDTNQIVYNSLWSLKTKAEIIKKEEGSYNNVCGNEDVIKILNQAFLVAGDKGAISERCNDSPDAWAANVSVIPTKFNQERKWACVDNTLGGRVFELKTEINGAVTCPWNKNF